MFKGLAPYPRPANLGEGVADGGVGVLTSLQRGKTVLSSFFTAETIPGDLGGLRGLMVDRSGFGAALGIGFLHQGRLKWGSGLDFEGDDFVPIYHSNPGAGVGDIMRVSATADDGTPGDGNGQGPKLVFGRGVGTPRNEPADWTVLASQQFGLHIRPYVNATGAGGAWIKVFGDNQATVLLDQINGTHRATRLDFGNGVNYRLKADIDGLNIQTFTLQDITNGQRVFHIIGSSMQIGGDQAATVTPLVIGGHASQSADVQQWFKGGTLVAKMRHDGLFGAAFLTNALDSGPYMEMGAGSGSIQFNGRGGGTHIARFIGPSGAYISFRTDGYPEIASSLLATTATAGAVASPGNFSGFVMFKNATGNVLKIPYFEN